MLVMTVVMEIVRKKCKCDWKYRWWCDVRCEEDARESGLLYWERVKEEREEVGRVGEWGMSG